MPTSCRVAGWKGSTFSTSNASKVSLVGVGGEQYVRVATFCGCFHSAATCSGDKHFLLLYEGLAHSQLSCLAVALLVFRLSSEFTVEVGALKAV